jgi:hypothetical protein
MLTVTQIRTLKPAPKPYKVPDVDGLFLLVQPSGALLWRFRFRTHPEERAGRAVPCHHQESSLVFGAA